jgi:2-keto-4-pentenoate hydratase/2-oxohepta-3-ene-1,7-dioic acid hydratase in catechol pathway
MGDYMPNAIVAAAPAGLFAPWLPALRRAMGLKEIPAWRRLGRVSGATCQPPSGEQAMSLWIRFEHAGQAGFGILERDVITVHSGDMFEAPAATSENLALDAVKVLTPCVPSKMVALWNNFHALAKKLELSPPEDPLYFLKANSSFLGTGETIRRPKSYDGRVVYEGELGIVIGRTCRGVSEQAAAGHIFGYTCIDDVTAVDLLNKDSTFAQWTRAKSFDGFGVFGPVIATGLDPAGLSIRTVLNGDERQNYPVSDMIFPPARLVSRISQDLTLLPGDVIACGTSLGVGSMKQPSNSIEITIDGIGTLSNSFVQ